MLSPRVRTPFVSLNLKYRGARLAAGFVDASLAAELMGLTDGEYREYEHSYGPDFEIVRVMARTFCVSIAYLTGSAAVTHREKLAEMIAEGMAQHEAGLPITGSTNAATRKLAAALVAMRQALGYETAAEAADDMDWNVLAYTAHEEGARAMTPEFLAFYALEYGLRPDLALQGLPPERLWDEFDLHWWRVQNRDEHMETGALVGKHFDWVRTGSSAAASLSLPVVEFVDGKWQLSEEEFRLSRRLLPAAATFVGDTLFAMLARAEDEVKLFVVDPTRTGIDSILATAGGHVVTAEATPAENVVDPTHYRAAQRNDFFCVGARVLELKISHADPE